MARLFGTLEGAKSTASRTGDDRLTARLATWHGAVVLTIDDHGTWTVHTEPADPQRAAATVPRVLARGNVHTDGAEYDYRCTCTTPSELSQPDCPTRRGVRRRPTRSPARKPGPDWTPYTTEERSNAR